MSFRAYLDHVFEKIALQKYAKSDMEIEKDLRGN
jgi:hypothetical protein